MADGQRAEDPTAVEPEVSGGGGGAIMDIAVEMEQGRGEIVHES